MLLTTRVSTPADDETSFSDARFYNWQDLDPAELKPRLLYYGRHYIAGAVSATIADGGVGKSILALTGAVAMATMRPLLGIKPKGNPDWESDTRLEVLYYNAEEPLDEIKRRVLAICQHYEIDHKELMPEGDWSYPLTILSGHDHPLVIGTANRDGLTFSKDVELLDEFEGNVIILDPFVSVHQCPENDNSAIDAIVKRLGRTAAGWPKSVELVHHARGASAVFDGVRSLRMLNRMTDAEALRAKVDNHRSYFRADSGKANYAAAAAESQWFRHQSVLLPNGDDVGVVVPWHMPGAFDGVTTAHMQSVRTHARSGKYRADPRSPDWIGGAIADVLDLDVEAEGDVKRIKIILKAWYAEGVLKKVEKRGTDRHPCMFVEPGEWTEP
jgi:RecA-family ATPase